MRVQTVLDPRHSAYLCTYEEALNVAASIPEGSVKPYPPGSPVVLKQMDPPPGVQPDPSGRLSYWILEWTEVVPANDGSSNNTTALREQNCALLYQQLLQYPDPQHWKYYPDSGTFRRGGAELG